GWCRGAGDAEGTRTIASALGGRTAVATGRLRLGFRRLLADVPGLLVYAQTEHPGPQRHARVHGQQAHLVARERLKGQRPVDDLIVVVVQPDMPWIVEEHLDRDLAPRHAACIGHRGEVVFLADRRVGPRITQKLVQRAERVTGPPANRLVAGLLEPVEFIDHHARHDEAHRLKSGTDDGRVLDLTDLAWVVDEDARIYDGQRCPGRGPAVDLGLQRRPYLVEHLGLLRQLH